MYWLNLDRNKGIGSLTGVSGLSIGTVFEAYRFRGDLCIVSTEEGRSHLRLSGKAKARSQMAMLKFYSKAVRSHCRAFHDLSSFLFLVGA